MQLKDIYVSIAAHITEEGHFVFIEATLGEAGKLLEDYFNEVMGASVFEIYFVVYCLPEKNLVTVCEMCDDGQRKAEAEFFGKRQFF